MVILQIRFSAKLRTKIGAYVAAQMPKSIDIPISRYTYSRLALHNLATFDSLESHLLCEYYIHPHLSLLTLTS